MMVNLGKSVAISKFGSSVLGLDSQLVDLGSLGLDPELFNTKVGTADEAVDLIRRGMLEELRSGGSLYDSVDPSLRPQLDTFATEVESMDVSQLGQLLKLTQDSQFRSLSIATSHGEALASRVQGFQNAAFRAISSSSIDAFYFARQGTLLPQSLEEAGSLIQKGFMEDYVSNIRDFTQQLGSQQR